MAFVEAMDELNNILDLDIEDQITTDVILQPPYLWPKAFGNGLAGGQIV